MLLLLRTIIAPYDFSSIGMNSSALQVHSRQFGLDLARTIAISLVLISHFAKVLDLLGFWGVELFFGLSGYLIGQILWRSYSKTNNWSTSNLVNFWSRRWWRTLPNYYLFLFVFLIIDYARFGLLPPVNKLINFFFFTQYFISHISSFYGVSWSLCIEEWFYLTFPLILLMVSSLKLGPKRSFALSILIMFSVCLVCRILLLRDGVGIDLRAITVGRLDAIGCGVGVAFYSSILVLSDRQKLIMLLIGLFLLGISGACPILLNMSYEKMMSDVLFLVLVPLGGALTLPYLASMRRPRFKLVASSIENISLWSYSIYLCHIPVLFITYDLMTSIRNTSLGNLLSKVVGLGLTFLISWLLYKYFETPLMNKRPRELKQQVVQKAV